MKLRIKGNSIRLRLLKSDMEKFDGTGRVSETVNFGVTALKYSLEMSTAADVIEAKFADNEITVLIPERAARDWAANDSVGFEIEQAIGPDQSLSIILEKDFVCIDRTDDPDRADAYPNPNMVC